VTTYARAGLRLVDAVWVYEVLNMRQGDEGHHGQPEAFSGRVSQRNRPFRAIAYAPHAKAWSISCFKCRFVVSSAIDSEVPVRAAKAARALMAQPIQREVLTVSSVNSVRRTCE
jgi:hypothetical protein